MFLLPQHIDHIMETAFTPEGAIRLNRLDETDFGDEWKHTPERG